MPTDHDGTAHDIPGDQPAHYIDDDVATGVVDHDVINHRVLTADGILTFTLDNSDPLLATCGDGQTTGVEGVTSSTTVTAALR